MFIFTELAIWFSFLHLRSSNLLSAVVISTTCVALSAPITAHFKCNWAELQDLLAQMFYQLNIQRSRESQSEVKK